MKIDYAKVNLIWSVLVVIALTVFFISKRKVNDSSELEKLLEQQVKELKSENETLKANIRDIQKKNAQIDTLIDRLNKKKNDVQIIYIERTKQIDNGSVDYLVGEFQIFFAKSNARR